MFETNNKLEYELGKLVQTAQILVTFNGEVHGNKDVMRVIGYEMDRLIRNITQNHGFQLTTDQMEVVAKIIVALREGYVPE